MHLSRASPSLPTHSGVMFAWVGTSGSLNARICLGLTAFICTIRFSQFAAYFGPQFMGTNSMLDAICVTFGSCQW